MYTCLVRLNSIVSYTTATFAVLTLAIYLTTAFDSHIANVDISSGPVTLRKGRDMTTNERSELANLNIDLKTDMTHLYNWNVKQLFIFLSAQYSTEKNQINDVVLWDKIQRRGSARKIRLQSAQTKYYFWDDGVGLRNNNNVTLYVTFNVIPIAGFMPLVKATGTYRLDMPSSYN
ncbi:hypothetical protein GJ496_007313 [Pomphorhynchus laevis]|nr:hypothetical protein GJ496_007313 [Pomphorhynchus laevis]